VSLKVSVAPVQDKEEVELEAAGEKMMASFLAALDRVTGGGVFKSALDKGLPPLFLDPLGNLQVSGVKQKLETVNIAADLLEDAPQRVIDIIEALIKADGGTLNIRTRCMEIYVDPSVCDKEARDAFEYVKAWYQDRIGNKPGTRQQPKKHAPIREVGDVDVELP